MVTHLPPYLPALLMAATIALLLVIERARPASALQKGEWGRNILAGGFGLISNVFLAGPLAGIVATGAVNALGGGLIDLTRLSWPFAAAAYLVTMDLGEYTFHRAQHAFPTLWSMHSLHHSDRAMNLSTAQRHYWLEPALKAVSIWLVVGLLFKVDVLIVSVYAIASLYNFFSHANVTIGFGRLSWLLNAPQYHRLHHGVDPSHHNANYAALLPIFDVITGAYHRPRPGEFPPTGLEQALDSSIQLVIWPLRRVTWPWGVGATLHRQTAK